MLRLTYQVKDTGLRMIAMDRLYPVMVVVGDSAVPSPPMMEHGTGTIMARLKGNQEQEGQL
ncbi:hypothetical protein D3C73_1311640 [compost metagenome]